jgi:membrane-associated phospholipid phosphatase
MRNLFVYHTNKVPSMFDITNASQVWNMISVFVIALFGYPFIKFIETNNVYYLLFGISAGIVDLSTKVIKAATANLGIQWQRPEGARGCDILCSMEKECAGRPGFPSGHATTAAFFATVLYLGASKKDKPRILAFGVFLVAIICASRYKKQCHNVLQLASGTLYGCATGILFYRMFHMFLKKTT